MHRQTLVCFGIEAVWLEKVFPPTLNRSSG